MTRLGDAGAQEWTKPGFALFAQTCFSICEFAHTIKGMNFSKEESFELLKTLVRARSYPGEETIAQKACANWLENCGIQTELQTTRNGQPNVLAYIKNGDGPSLLLNGHMDTVLAAQGWNCDPWEGKREGDIFYALGAADMKSGVVANMLVARELAQRKNAWRGTLIFSSVTDEEAYSYGAHALVDGGVKADACIITEPHFEAACIGGPGKILIHTSVTGKAAHGFRPWEGINAGVEAARFAAGVDEAVPALKHAQAPSSQAVLSINAGSELYVVTLPEKASVAVTRLTVPGETREQILGKMRAFASSLNSPATFEFGVKDPYYTPWVFDQPEHPFMRAFDEAHRAALGRDVIHDFIGGITDANVICGEGGIPCIVYGPRGDNFHQCQEWVDLASVPAVCDVVAGAALRFLQ